MIDRFSVARIKDDAVLRQLNMIDKNSMDRICASLCVLVGDASFTYTLYFCTIDSFLNRLTYVYIFKKPGCRL